VNLEDKIDENEKYILENLLTLLMKQKKLHHVNLRISNVYGNNLEYGLINSVLESHEKGTHLNLFNNLNVIRDYISLNDVYYAIQELAKLDLSFKSINVSTGVGTSIYEILQIFSRFGHPVSKYINVELPINMKLYSILNCSTLASNIDWNPTKVEDGIFNLYNK
jgi:nucleoside-diphosphate-sugar epimerase